MIDVKALQNIICDSSTTASAALQAMIKYYKTPIWVIIGLSSLLFLLIIGKLFTMKIKNIGFWIFVLILFAVLIIVEILTLTNIIPYYFT